jgi:hypothetical protein
VIVAAPAYKAPNSRVWICIRCSIRPATWSGEGFEVDYLKKNLRVKRRGGKTWDFAHSSGNADPLFVFHRETEQPCAATLILRGGAPRPSTR